MDAAAAGIFCCTCVRMKYYGSLLRPPAAHRAVQGISPEKKDE